MLIFNSSISVAFARSKHVITEDRCSGNYNNVGIKTSTTCCYESWDEDRVTHKISNYMKWCRICDTSGFNSGPSTKRSTWGLECQLQGKSAMCFLIQATIRVNNQRSNTFKCSTVTINVPTNNCKMS